MMFIGFSHAAGATPENYGYEGNDWLDTCKTGLKQSPINIPVSIARTREEERAIKNSSDLELEIVYQNPTNLTVLNTGTTFKSDVKVGDITFWNQDNKSEEYKVLQFHFHAPSEHTFDGAHYDLEMHIVH